VLWNSLLCCYQCNRGQLPYWHTSAQRLSTKLYHWVRRNSSIASHVFASQVDIHTDLQSSKPSCDCRSGFCWMTLFLWNSQGAMQHQLLSYLEKHSWTVKFNSILLSQSGTEIRKIVLRRWGKRFIYMWNLQRAGRVVKYRLAGQNKYHSESTFLANTQFIPRILNAWADYSNMNAQYIYTQTLVWICGRAISNINSYFWKHWLLA